eukprot:4603949-Amphidinium_carterae.3
MVPSSGDHGFCGIGSESDDVDEDAVGVNGVGKRVVRGCASGDLEGVYAKSRAASLCVYEFQTAGVAASSHKLLNVSKGQSISDSLWVVNYTVGLGEKCLQVA